MDPTCGFQPSGTTALSSSSPPAFFLWHCCVAKRSLFSCVCVNTDVSQELFSEDLGVFWFQDCVQIGGSCACTELDPKVKFYALCPSQIVWNRSAQTDSNQTTLDGRTGRASLLSSIPPDPFGPGEMGSIHPQERHIKGLVQVRAVRSSSSGRAVPCRAHPPSLEGTGTTGCLLSHTRLKISHQNKRQQNNFCEMFLSSALGQLPPEAATLPSLSESHLQLQEFPSHPVLRPWITALLCTCRVEGWGGKKPLW